MTFRAYGDTLRGLWRSGPACNLVVLSQVDSTNTKGREFAERFFEDADVPPTTFVVAEEQTAGRGRAERTWESKPGRGAYITMVHCLGESPEPGALQSLPILLGTALCEALQTFSPDVRLKWPNDLYVGGRKVGGILIETCTSEDAEVAVVAGFGINLQPPADSSLEATATGLETVCDAPPELPALVVSLCEAAAGCLLHLGDMNSALERYREVSLHQAGDAITCQLGERRVEGSFIGFDDNGCLCIETSAGQETVAAGDVIFHHPALG